MKKEKILALVMLITTIFTSCLVSFASATLYNEVYKSTGLNGNNAWFRLEFYSPPVNFSYYYDEKPYTSADYQLVSSNDAQFAQYSNYTLYWNIFDSSFHRFNISQNISQIKQLDIFFKAYTNTPGNEARPEPSDLWVYIYNYGLGDWEYLGLVKYMNTVGFVNHTFKKQFIEDKVFENYINKTSQGNYLWLLAQSINAIVSCPFVYSYDGQEYHFDHEAYPFATTKVSEENSYGRLEHLKPVNGKYIIKIGERLDEVSYINDFELLVIDHPGNGIIMPDVNGNIHTINEKILPKNCLSKNNQDCLDKVSEIDSEFYRSDETILNNEDLYDYIELEFENSNFDSENIENSKLIVDFQSTNILSRLWMYYVNLIGENNWDSYESFLEFPLFKKWHLNLMDKLKLEIQIWDDNEWKSIGKLGSGKQKLRESLVLIPLYENNEKVKIRLKQVKGLYEINRVYMDFSKDEEMKITKLNPETALKNASGIINDVSEELSSDNNNYVVLEKGDDIDLVYNEIPKYKDWKRDFSIRIKGYYNYDIRDNKTSKEFLNGLKKGFELVFNEDELKYLIKELNKKNTIFVDYVHVNVSYLQGDSSLYNVTIHEPFQNRSYARESIFPMICSADTGAGTGIKLLYQFKFVDKWFNIPVSKDVVPVTSTLESNYVNQEYINKLFSNKKINKKELKENKNPNLKKELVRIYLKEIKDLDKIVPMQLDIVDNNENYVDAVLTTEEIKKLEKQDFEIENSSFIMEDVFNKSDDYHTYEETLIEMQTIVTNYPDIARMYNIGQSIEGRTIWAIKISDNVALDEDEPEILIVGGHSGRELMSSEIPLFQAKYFTENYEIDYKINEIVNNIEIWFIPIINPDGHVYVEKIDPLWPKNRRDNGDGTFGVDIKRNYGYQWGYDEIGSSSDSSTSNYRGTSAFSEPETQAIKNFIDAHNITYALSYYNYGEQIFYPWDYINQDTPDHAKFLELANALQSELPNYKIGNPLDFYYPSNGDFNDYLYGEKGIFALTIRVNNYFQGGFRPVPYYIPYTVREQIPPLINFLESAADFKLYLEIDENNLPDIVNKKNYTRNVRANTQGTYEIRCSAHNDTYFTSSKPVEIDIQTPFLNISLLEPQVNLVEKEKPFDFKVNISCTGFDCSEVDVYLDPEEKNFKKQTKVADSDKGYIVEFYEEPVFKIIAENQKRLELLEKRAENKDLGSFNTLNEINTKTNNLKEQIKKQSKEQSDKIKATHNLFKQDAVKKLSNNKLSIQSSSQIKISHEYSKVLNAIALDITKEEAEQLLSLEYVKAIYPVKEYKLLMDYTIDWLNIDDVWNYQSNGTSLTGHGVIIANLDSGVDITHSMFGNDNHPVFKNCTDFANCAKVLDAWDFANRDAEPWDDNGHGTHTASTNAGINDGVLKGGMAPDAKLYIYKVCGSGGGCYSSDIIAGIERATDPNNDKDYSDKADIISMSLGADCGSAGYPPDCGPDDLTSKAIDNAADIGVISIISAGNSDGQGRIGCPACARKAIAVAAACKPFDAGNHFQCSDDIADFSSRGPMIYNGTDFKKPEIIAPGVWICAARGVNYQGNDRYPLCFDDEHVRVSGTSMSAPHMAGIGALIVQDNPGIKWNEFEQLIQETALDLGYSYDEQGAGLINPKQALGSIYIDYLRIEPEFVGLGYNVKCITNIKIKENYNISKVEFTIKDPLNNTIFKNITGTSVGTIWTSPDFIINKSGTWKCEARAYDTTSRISFKTISFSTGDKGLVSTVIGDEPFYTLDSNPQSCFLRVNKSCIVNWRVIPTGQIGSEWEFFSYAKFRFLPTRAVETEKINLTIFGTEIYSNLIHPGNNIKFSQNRVDFKCSAENYSSQITELSLYTDVNNWSKEYTVYNSNVLEHTLLNIPKGSYKWNCLAKDNNSKTDWGNINRTFTILDENQSSVMFITYPLNKDYFSNITNLNYYAQGFEKCWYSVDNGKTNSSRVNAGESFDISSVEGENNWIIWCEDSLGNTASDNVNFKVLKNYVEGELIVGFKTPVFDPGTYIETVFENKTKVETVNRIFSIKPAVNDYKKQNPEVEDFSDEKIFTLATRKMNTKEKELYNIYKIKIPENTDIGLAINKLIQDPNIEFAEPNYIFTLDMLPNDPYFQSSGAWGQEYDDLWNLKRIQTRKAWDISQGEGVLVAVIDTGVDWEHEDLAENIWINKKEDINNNGIFDQGDNNGIDDDNNGFIDDVVGWDFVGPSYMHPEHDNIPSDSYGHGTHCSGIVAGVGNNSLGVIGVAPKAKILIVKGFSDSGNAQLAELAAAVFYAIDNGANITSNSWGCEGCHAFLLEKAFNYGYSKGVLSVASAGNSWNQNPHYPAWYQSVIDVSASEYLDNITGFSNYGSEIEVSAPGGGIYNELGNAGYEDAYNILSTLTHPSRMTAAYPQLKVSEGYYRLAGTSMSAPHVAGVAALMLSQNPKLTNENIRTKIKLSADDVGPIGKDIYHGYGRVNAYKALIYNFSVFIDSPDNSQKYVNKTTDILGEAVFQDYFQKYEIYIAPKNNSNDTTMITTSLNQVRGILGNFDSTQYSDGEYILTLKLYSNHPEFKENYHSVDMFIDNYNDPLEFINLKNQLAVINRTFKFKINVKNLDNPETPWGNLSYSIEGLPLGAVFNTTTGLLVWNLTENDKGVHEIKITVSDNEYSISKNISITTLFIEHKPIIPPGRNTYFYDMAIYNDKVVFIENTRTGNWKHLNMYDISTGQETQIVNGYGPKYMYNFDLYEDIVIYADSYNHLFMYNISSGQNIKLINNTEMPNPRYGIEASKDKVLWREASAGDTLVMYDISTKEVTHLTNKTLLWGFDIYNDIVVYSFSDGLPFDLVLYNITSKEKIQLTNYSMAQDWAPQIYKDLIVWGKNQYPDLEAWIKTYAYNLSSGKEFEINHYDPLVWGTRYVHTMTGRELGVFNDKVIWFEGRVRRVTYPPNVERELYMKDIKFDKEVFINEDHCSAQGQFTFNSIHNNKIVWARYNWSEDDPYYELIELTSLFYAPSITSINPTSVAYNDSITIKGENFGYLPKPDGSYVKFANNLNCTLETWDDDEITCKVPENAMSGFVKVVTKGGESNGILVTISGDARPVVSLDLPVDDSSFDQGVINFTCSAIDDNQLENITLYVWNLDGNLVYQETALLSGTSDSAEFNYNFNINDTYYWNCLAYDNSSQSDWYDNNYTLTIGYVCIDEDVDCKNGVNIQDLVLVAKDIGKTGCNSGNNWCDRRDVTRDDGIVSIRDLVKVAMAI
jgi:subtilisin family serine protease